jgi:dTDP-4-dehydrorhamnose 3,5-epimerase
MTFRETPLAGAFLIELERHPDERGFFARTFDPEELAAHGLSTRIVQMSMARNTAAGTVRGMHFQFPPFAEVKLVRCTRGAVLDVIVDLRPESPTFGRHYGVELDAEAGATLYIPERFAHGYQTLSDDADVNYAMTAPYAPDAAAGLRHDDPALGISWPLPVTAISERDTVWPLFDEARAELVRRLDPS